MADNTTLNAMTGGDVIATDDVSSVKYQQVKLVDGTLNSTAVIPGDATNGLDVDVTRVSGNVAVTNAGLTELAAAINASSQMDVNIAASSASVSVQASATFPVAIDEPTAPTTANNQVVPTATAATLVTGRAGRAYCTILNNSNMTVFIGIATVTTANGFPLAPGAAVDWNGQALCQLIVASVTGLTGYVAYIDHYF